MFLRRLAHILTPCDQAQITVKSHWATAPDSSHPQSTSEWPKLMLINTISPNLGRL
jgi:hypothetical protein